MSIDDYYGKAYSFDLWDIKILDIQRPEGERTFNFIIKIQVIPFVGAHNSVGVDNITMKISTLNEVKVIKFEHLKSYINGDDYKSS